MKFQSQTVLPGLNKSTMKKLVSIVEERLDIPDQVKTQQKFTSAEMWMINKQRKVFFTRKYL